MVRYCNKLPGEVVESLEVIERCLDVTCGDIVWGDYGGAELVVSLVDLECLLQI